MNPVSFFDLVSAMKTQTSLLVPIYGAVKVQGISLEDGSGRNWNITLRYVNSGQKQTVFWSEKSSHKANLFLMPE